MNVNHETQSLLPTMQKERWCRGSPHPSPTPSYSTRDHEVSSVSSRTFFNPSSVCGTVLLQRIPIGLLSSAILTNLTIIIIITIIVIIVIILVVIGPLNSPRQPRPKSQPLPFPPKTPNEERKIEE